MTRESREMLAMVYISQHGGESISKRTAVPPDGSHALRTSNPLPSIKSLKEATCIFSFSKTIISVQTLGTRASNNHIRYLSGRYSTVITSVSVTGTLDARDHEGYGQNKILI